MEETQENQEYRVLARKYRPRNFDELIGQDALVRTLKNSITSGRIAHAFMLTGVRGVGKTTTARIIARSLNYTGPDGQSGPTVGPTDDCSICQAIAEDRHPDVMEMDAASRTGVDDIREILDGVRYATVSARYKIYIIDEVHMLSKSAFNALLKTLEEPPEHVKFIFATTEIRKVPVTVLSRCQRFDLKRVDIDVLSGHFKSICDKENVTIDDTALEMISRAADGSVRDGLSILDQAISMGQGNVDEALVSSMLGLADRMMTLALMQAIIDGKPDGVFDVLGNMYASGADSIQIIQDLLELVHALSMLKALETSPKADDIIARQTTLPHSGRDQSKAMAHALELSTLNRCWQILSRAVPEVMNAENPKQALDMVVLRVMYGASLPDPAKMLKRLQQNKADNAGQTGAMSMQSQGAGAPEGAPMMRAVAGGRDVRAEAQMQPVMAQAKQVQPKNMEDIVALIEDAGELVLADQVRQYARPVKVQTGRIEFVPVDGAPTNLSARMKSILESATGDRWMIALQASGGNETIAERLAREKQELWDMVSSDENVKKVLSLFPGATIHEIHENGDKSDV